MLTQIGAAVATERKRQGLRIEDLGVDASVVARLEAGAPGLTTTQLEVIARTLQVDPIALRRGTIVARPQPSVFLRHNAIQDFDTEDATTLDQVLDHARARNVLARLVGDDVGLFPRAIFATRAVAGDSSYAPAQQGHQLAREVRSALGIEASPVGDLRELSEVTLGVTVVVRSLVTLGSSAIAVKAADAGAIVLATGASGASVRVWLAHELCHLLFDPDVGGVHVAVDFVTDRRVQQAEQRARAFAAEFLVPAAGLRELLGPPQSTTGAATATRIVQDARERFGATWQVTANQVCNQGFVDKTLRDWLESLWPSPPSNSPSTTISAVGGPSLHVASLARRAHEAGLVTDSEVRGLLDLDLLTPLPWDPR